MEEATQRKSATTAPVSSGEERETGANQNAVNQQSEKRKQISRSVKGENFKLKVESFEGNFLKIHFLLALARVRVRKDRSLTKYRERARARRKGTEGGRNNNNNNKLISCIRGSRVSRGKLHQQNNNINERLAGNNNNNGNSSSRQSENNQQFQNQLRVFLDIRIPVIILR